MEVHHHAHIPTSREKKWTHYFWEFLMLFLAVTLGFFVENQREHFIEHQREKKFAKRLLSDLKQDSAFLAMRFQQFEERQKNEEEFLKIMTNPLISSDSAVMNSFKLLLRSFRPEFNTATYEQMKTSGSLRYIQNDSVTTAIQEYYEILVPKIYREQPEVHKLFTEYIVPYITRHFKFQDLSETLNTKYIIIHRTPESDQEIVNIMGVYGSGWDVVFGYCNQALEHIQNLIPLVRKEYQLK